MGLFCLATKNTLEDDVKTAICNLQLFLDHSNGTPPLDYLLDFALHNIENAKKRLEENNDNKQQERE